MSFFEEYLREFRECLAGFNFYNLLHSEKDGENMLIKLASKLATEYDCYFDF